VGLPESFLDEKRFRFADSLASTAEEKANPWLLLNRKFDDGAIPVIADATTAEWTLHIKLGDSLAVPPLNKGETKIPIGSRLPVHMRVVGLLQDSIFQSELLMSSKNFEQLYPDQGGFRFFLIAAGQDEAVQIKNLLTRSGFEVTGTRQRLQAYLEVENTYLATFQALGSLGLVLGTLGLGIVLLRSVWERRGELALLRALGFRQFDLGWLVLAENGYLLLLGLAVGTVAALLAVLPQLLAGTGTVPWLRLLGLLAAVVFAGLLAGVLALVSSLRADLIPALRKE
jgi:ABC-type antimicrobial peptide transport system permease subunit